MAIGISGWAERKRLKTTSWGRAKLKKEHAKDSSVFVLSLAALYFVCKSQKRSRQGHVTLFLAASSEAWNHKSYRRGVI
jgi:hypothetical protein